MTTPKPTRALIVDDDPVVARAIARRLLREGYTVSLAGTCRAARAGGTGFDVAVLDLDLPDGSGADLADDLLRLGAARAVVFYTGSVDSAQREQAARSGTVVDKSKALDELVGAVEMQTAAPPVSEMAPAPRAWPRGSGARLSRVVSDDEAISESALSSRSSRR